MTASAATPGHPAAVAGTPSVPHARIVAVDLARWLAIVGMMSAHQLGAVAASWSGRTDPEARVADVAFAAANGNASSLFAVLAGVSLVLATRTLRAHGRRAAALRSVAGRAAVVMAAGVVLASWMPPVHVVLNYLAWAMVLAVPLVLAPSWVVGGVAVALWLGGSQVATAVVAWRFGDGPGRGADALEGSALAPFADLMFTGEYPAVTWVAMLAVGILLARAILAARSPGRARLLGGALVVGGGAAATVAVLVSQRAMAAFADTWAAQQGQTQTLPYLLRYGTGTPPDGEWWWQLTSIPHTGTIVDVLRGVGLAAAVLGALVMLLPPGARLPRILEPVRAAGAAPFTIYTLHVIALLVAVAVAFALGAEGGLTPAWYRAGLGIVALHVAGSIAVGAVLAATGSRGPLERIASAAARSFAHARDAVPAVVPRR